VEKCGSGGKCGEWWEVCGVVGSGGKCAEWWEVVGSGGKWWEVMGSGGKWWEAVSSCEECPICSLPNHQRPSGVRFTLVVIPFRMELVSCILPISNL
jgi:hypothetical protein